MSAQEPVINPDKGAREERMKRIRFISLALVAAVAISAVAAASASAEPEFKPGKAFPVNFSSSSATAKSKLETVGKNTVECVGLESSGKITAARKVENIVVKFKGCTTNVGFKVGCEGGPGHKAQEIVTATLKAKPVFIEGKTGAKEERGFDVEPETSGEHFAEFKCGFFTTIVVKNKVATENSVIGRVAGAEVGKQEKEATIKFKQKNGVQEPTKYEEPAGTLKGDFLESEIGGATPEQSAEEASETIKYEGGETVELT
jgi:hypothetical protein